MCTSSKTPLFGFGLAHPREAGVMAGPAGSEPGLLSPAPEAPVGPAAAGQAAPAGSSRRRRLWDLDRHAHCPLVGVCLPMAALRRLVDKVRGQVSTADDYDLHSSVVGECRSRTVLSEALNKHLDQRYALTVQRAARLKTTEALAAWWTEASAGHDLPAAFWAVLTHPRCDSRLEYLVLGQVHMLQHQVGMATRAELARFEALIDENAVLARELSAAQQRSLRQAADFAARAAELEASLVRQRGLTLARDTQLAQQNEAMAALEAAVPRLRERHHLMQEASVLREQVQDLQRELSLLRETLRREQDKTARLEDERTRWQAQLAARREPTEARSGASVLPLLRGGADPRGLLDQAVLCVGGRQASVPLYRLVVERTGGRFLHHDGGEQDSPNKLDATLAAADLVICQTGCVSHDAYWRVKDHCKRTGKRCLFVDTPSRAALERALATAIETIGDSAKSTTSTPQATPPTAQP